MPDEKKEAPVSPELPADASTQPVDNAAVTQPIEKEIVPLPKSSDSPLSAPQAQPVELPTDVQDAGVTYPPPGEVVPRGPSKKKFIVLGLVVVTMLFGIATCGIGVAAAYGKLSFVPIDLQRKLADVVFRIPFLPKSPDYVLHASLEAHKKVSSAALDLSLAVDSESVSNLFGNSSLDIALSGTADFNDRDNPQISLNAKYTNDLDVDLLYMSQKGCAKLNKAPQALTLFFTLPEALLNTWVCDDFSNLDTDARAFMDDARSTTPDATDKAYGDIIQTVFTKEILPAVVMTQDTLNGFDVYILTLDMTKGRFKDIAIAISELSEDLDAPSEKDLEFFEKGQLVLWIDKKDYYLRKAVLSLDLSVDTATRSLPVIPGGIYLQGAPTADVLPQKDAVHIVMSLQLSKFGERFDVSLPAQSFTPEEFMMKIFESTLESSESLEIPEENLPDSSVEEGSLPSATVSPFGSLIN